MLDGVDWGDVPGWVSAATTVLALAGAAYAAYTGFQLLKLEAGRDKGESDRRTQSQATLVSAWWGRGTDGSGDSNWGVYLRNASNAPVYQAHVRVEWVGLTSKSSSYGLPVLPPDEHERFVKFMSGSDDPVEATLHSGAAVECQVVLSFTDSSGVRWRRDRYGRLDQQSQKELVIWAAPEAGDVLTQFAADSLASYDIRIHCRTDVIGEKLASKFRNSRPAPDILIGPHDWAGLLADEGTVRALHIHDEARKRLPAISLDSMTYKGNLYAIPSSMDTVVLVRNLSLAKDPPQTIEELIAHAGTLDVEGVTGCLAVPVGQAGNPFHLWPMFRSLGGWLFRLEGDRWDTSRTGLAESESIAAFSRIQDLGREGILKKDVDINGALQAFVRNEVPFMLATLGTVLRALQIGVPLGISRVPKFADGVDATPFVAVNGLFVAQHGENADLASEFVVDYATRPDVARALASLGALSVVEDWVALNKSFEAICLTGDLMPNFRQMESIWRLLAKAEVDLLDGHDSAEVAVALDSAVVHLFD